MSMRVWTRDDKAIVNCHFNEKEFVKAIGDYKYDKESKCWFFPLKKLIDIIENLKVEYNDETYAVYEQLREERVRRHQLLNLANDIKNNITPAPTKLLTEGQLFAHQAQAVELGSIFDSYAFFMETGCITGDTLIYDPIKNEHTPIQQLVTRDQRSFNVLSMDENGMPVIGEATHAFCKGIDAIYEVTTRSNKKIKCTANHRLFSKHGWTFVSDLFSGDSILIVEHPSEFSSYLQESRQGISPSMSREGVRHLNCVAQDCSTCYSCDRRLCDERLHHDQDIDQDIFPLQGDVPSHNYALSYEDDQGNKQGHTHRDQFFSHPSMPDFRFRDMNQLHEFLHHALSLDPKCEIHCSQDVAQSVLSKGFPLPMQQLVSYQFLPSSAYKPSFVETDECNTQSLFYKSDTIKSIRKIGIQKYYDMEVPIYHNYVANNILHHNTGKTLVAIELIKHFNNKAMVVAPLPTLESVWAKEIQKWSNLRYANLWKRLDDIHKKNVDVYLINYEQFKILHKKQPGVIEKRIGTLIIDESSKLKNPKADITKTILYYKNRIPNRFCLTGTPAPNNLLEYWAQIAFINDEILPTTFYKYRNTFFYSTGYGGYMYRPCKGAKESIMELISKQAFSIRKQDCLDLPERVYEVREIEMDDVQQAAYDEMKELNVLEYQGNIVLSANELAKIMKLRQVTAGFIINAQGIPLLISETKMDTLKALLEEIPEDQQVIVWCQFHFEIERIRNEYKKECVTLYGVMSQKDKTQAIQDFMDGKKRILIAHPKTGGMGLNFQKNCSYMVWYSLSYSQEEYSQACDRIYRSGQTNRCTYYILCAKSSIDGVIYKALKGKASLMESCLEILKKGEL